VLPRLRACLRSRFGKQAETCLRTEVLRHAGAPHFGVQARKHEGTKVGKNSIISFHSLRALVPLWQKTGFRLGF